MDRRKVIGDGDRRAEPRMDNREAPEKGQPSDKHIGYGKKCKSHRGINKDQMDGRKLLNPDTTHIKIRMRNPYCGRKLQT